MTYEGLGLYGLGLGAEIGADIGEKFYLHGGVSEGLAYFSLPYVTTVDFNAGYQITPAFFVDLGIASSTRKIKVVGTQSGLDLGELTDGQVMGKLGVGFSL